MTLTASTRGMENDVRRALKRAESGGKISPKVDSSGATREGRNFMSKFNAAASSGSDTVGKAMGGKLMAGFAAVASAAAFAAVAQVAVNEFRRVFETGLDFSRTLNNFKGVTRATTAEMAAMQSKARELGGDTTLAGASASEAALAMTELAKAGFSIDQAMSAARGTLELATAGQLDAAQAAEIQANAMNAFSLPKDLETAAHVTDLLSNAAIASSADVTDVGQSLQQVGGIAHGFGVSIDDTVAALAMFANAGIKGSDAGTLLKTTMQSITDQGNPAQGAIKDLGLELYNFDNHEFVGFRGPNGLFAQLDEAKKRLNNPEQFQALTNILFGSDAMRSAMLGNAEAFDQMYEQMQRAGSGAELAQAQMEGLPGAVDSFDNALEGIRLDVFDAIGPTATAGLAQIVEWMGEHKPEIVQFMVDISDSAIAMGQVFVKSLGLLSEGFGQIIGGLGNVLGAMLKTGSFFQRITGNTEVADQWLAEAEAMYGWGESLQAFGQEAKNVNFDGIRDNIKAQAEQSTLASQAARDLGDNIALLPDEKTIVLKDNTAEAIAKIDQTKYKIETLPDGQIKIIPLTEEATRRLDGWIGQQTGKKVPIGVTMDPGQAKAEFDRVFAPLLHPSVTPQVVVPPGTNALDPSFFAPAPPPRRAAGGPIFGPGGPTDDKIPAWLSNGEHVLTAADVAAMGGQAGVYAFRNALHHRTGGQPLAVPWGVDPHGSRDKDNKSSAGPFGPWWDMDWMPPEHPGAVGPGNGRWWYRGPTKGGKTKFAFPPIGNLPGMRPRTPDDPIINNNDPEIWPWGFAGGGAADSRGSKAGLQPNASQLWDILVAAFPQIETIGGVRQDPIPDHPSGRALDIMIPAYDTPEGKALGDQINAFIRGNADALGIDSTIWRDTWADFAGNTSTVAGHQNHIHAKVTAGPATGAALSSFSALNATATTGAYGYDTPDPQKIADAEENLRAQRADVAIQEQQLRELKADASESQRMSAEEQLRKAKADEAKAVQELAEAKRGEPLDAPDSTSSKSGGRDMGGESLGQSIISGMLQTIGLDGSLFSNPLEWPNVKSGMALANWGAGMLGMGGSGGGIPGLGALLSPGGGPASRVPMSYPDAAHAGTGAPPGPQFVVNGNVGMDPRALTQRFDAGYNAAWRRNMNAVRPGNR